MNPEQEPKYDIVDGKIVNRATGEAIPDDEPIFIMRARDKHACQGIHDYAKLCVNPFHRDIVRERAIQFSQWARANPDRMHEPTSPN